MLLDKCLFWLKRVGLSPAVAETSCNATRHMLESVHRHDCSVYLPFSASFFFFFLPVLLMPLTTRFFHFTTLFLFPVIFGSLWQLLIWGKWRGSCFSFNFEHSTQFRPPSGDFKWPRCLLPPLLLLPPIFYPGYLGAPAGLETEVISAASLNWPVCVWRQ